MPWRPCLSILLPFHLHPSPSTSDQTPSDGKIRQRPIVEMALRAYESGVRKEAQSFRTIIWRVEVMRDEKKQDKKANEELVAKNMKRINREIALSLFFLKHGCPG
jgi:hypothetical protein